MDLEHIQWFPGHMTKAIRMMEENIKLCDGVIYVVDARAPFACENKRLSKVFGNKPVLYVLNKSDLISPADRSFILGKYAAQGKKAVCVVGTDAKSVKEVYGAFCGLFAEKLERNKQKGVTKILRAMVAGLPNTGKSTIINSLCGRKAAQIGDKAGVTRSKQWVKLNGFELLDTPGTMPPSVENNELALHLAFVGSLNDDLLDAQDLSIALIDRLKIVAENALSKKYGIDEQQKTSLEILEAVCAKRGCLIKGGGFDYERCGKIIIDEFRKGKIGKICLEGVKFNSSEMQ